MCGTERRCLCEGGRAGLRRHLKSQLGCRTGVPKRILRRDRQKAAVLSAALLRRDARLAFEVPRRTGPAHPDQSRGITSPCPTRSDLRSWIGIPFWRPDSFPRWNPAELFSSEPSPGAPGKPFPALLASSILGAAALSRDIPPRPARLRRRTPSNC
jgi:hypothetical protein